MTIVEVPPNTSTLDVVATDSVTYTLPSNMTYVLCVTVWVVPPKISAPCVIKSGCDRRSSESFAI